MEKQNWNNYKNRMADTMVIPEMEKTEKWDQIRMENRTKWSQSKMMAMSSMKHHIHGEALNSHMYAY